MLPKATTRPSRTHALCAAVGAVHVASQVHEAIVPMDLDQHHHFADVEGCQLHWVEGGEATAEAPLVLLHGLNDCHLTWNSIAFRLMRDRRVLVLDLPGHGLSGRPDASYELSWYARLTARWLEALGLDTVDVVGHSFGGGVALMMLLECPERIRRLVLVSSGGLGRQIAVALRLASIPGVVERFGQPFMGAGTRLALKATGERLSKEEVAGLSAMNSRSGSARAFARTVHDIIDWRGQRQTLFKRVGEITQLPSIAVFWGDRDPIIPASHAQVLADRLEGIRVKVFDGCGHYPHHERPVAFVNALRDFLDDTTVLRAHLRDGRGEREGVGALRAEHFLAEAGQRAAHSPLRSIGPERFAL
jgi:pimeloyl-ACP methyl ester carboxylesterase